MLLRAGSARWRASTAAPSKNSIAWSNRHWRTHSLRPRCYRVSTKCSRFVTSKASISPASSPWKSRRWPNNSVEIAAGGIEPRILLSAIDTLSKQQPAGGVRDIARTIEKQITDGLIDAKAERARRIRLQADGERIRVVPESDERANQQTGESSAGLAKTT